MSRKEKLEENTIYKKANKITIPHYCPLIVTKIKVKCNTTPFFSLKKRGKKDISPLSITLCCLKELRACHMMLLVKKVTNELN